jgi:AraC-like DNA-binding protein/ABC-type transporter Mla MlaB component
MIETAYAPFLESTVGRYTVTGSSFVWCASKALCGVVLWGEQTREETRAILHVLDQYPHQMADAFAVVLDTRGVVRVDPGALSELFAWLLARRADLSRRIQMQANLIREGPVGFLLTGLLPVAQWSLPYRIHFEPLDAFRSVAGDEADALCAEVEAIALRVRGESRELRATRALLEHRLDVTIAEVSRAAGTSARSLQRALARHATSFHRELATARLARAQTLLLTGDAKIAAVAAAVGISERALTSLFRTKTGLGPAEWRKRERHG